VTDNGGTAAGWAPRYRVEHRVAAMATLIVGFADTPRQYRSLVAVGAGRALRERAGGEIVVVDQETETDLASRPVWSARASPPPPSGEPRRGG
jgi:hypothetical protein